MDEVFNAFDSDSENCFEGNIQRIKSIQLKKNNLKINTWKILD